MITERKNEIYENMPECPTACSGDERHPWVFRLVSSRNTFNDAEYAFGLRQAERTIEDNAL
jgi:hypothetical protein